MLAVLTAIVSLLIASLLISYSDSAQAQKRNPTKPLTTSADLDHAFVTGAQVFYQLTDEELGENIDQSIIAGLPFRKVPAIITFNYFGRRDADGRRVWSLHILRPGFLGGPFDKDEVPADSGRDPGTFDTIHAGDLVQ